MDDFREKLILKEIEMVENKIDNYDKHSLIIKGWAITLFSAIWLWIIEQRINNNSNDSLVWTVLISFILITFWLFDSLYKFYQRAFVVRINQIEKYLNDKELYKKYTENYNVNEQDSIVLFNPTGEKSRSDEFKELHKLKRCFFLRGVSTLYLALLGISFFGVFYLFAIYLAAIFNILLFILGFFCLVLMAFLLKFGYDDFFDRLPSILKKRRIILIHKITKSNLKTLLIEDFKDYDNKIKSLYDFYRKHAAK